MISLTTAAAALATLLSAGPARPEEPCSPEAAGSPAEAFIESGPACLLAVVDGAAIDDSDADELRTLLQPPPGREEARRLAVDAALAHFWLRGYVAPSSARARLEAWRAFLVTIRPDIRDEADEVANVQAALHQLAARSGLVAGPCLQASPDRTAVAEIPRGLIGAEVPGPRLAAARLLQRAGSRESLVRLQIRVLGSPADGCVAPITEVGSRSTDLGLVPLGHLDRDLALAAAELPVGGTSGPIGTRFGLVSVSVLERIEPRVNSPAPSPGGASSRAVR